MHYSIIYLVVSKEMVRCCKKALRTSRVKKGDKEMNDIIKKIEDAQLKAEAPLVIPLKFTVKSKRVTVSVSRYSKALS